MKYRNDKYFIILFTLSTLIFVNAVPAGAQVADVISNATFPTMAITFPLSYGILSLLIENYIIAKKRLLVGLTCSLPIYLQIYVDHVQYPPWNKTPFELIVPLILYGTALIIPIYICVKLEGLSIGRVLLRPVLASLAGTAGLLIIYYLNGYISFLPDKVLVLLPGITLGVIAGIVFWFTRNRISSDNTLMRDAV